MFNISIFQINDNGELYYENPQGKMIIIGVDLSRHPKEGVEKQNLESAKKLYKLLQFKIDLIELYQKHNITIEYDYDSMSVEFKDDYSNDYILHRINSEIDKLKQAIGE